MSASGTIGALALYLLFAWLISAAAGAWLTARKGYGERVGLMLGLVLTVAGLLIALLLPSRPGKCPVGGLPLQVDSQRLDAARWHRELICASIHWAMR